MKATHVLVHLAVNNFSGLCSGQVAQIQLGKDCSMTLEAMWWDDHIGDFGGPAFQYHFSGRRRGLIQIRKRRFRFQRYSSHVGNICWDAVAVPVKDVLRFLRWARRHELFDCTEAPSELYDLWHSRRAIKPKHLKLL
jgi:hypothetical protein